jgi:uncharacterized cupredoxin-like copper-binding protein
MSSLRPLPALLCLAGALAACRSDAPPREAATADPGSGAPVAATPAAAAAAPITVTATDFKFDLPATITGGAVNLHLVNHGQSMHHAQVVRLDEGKTVADLAAALKHEGPPPPWLHFVGGPNGIVPGQEANAVALLSPGHYAMLCFIPGTDGIPHVAKGMLQPFEVTAGPADAALPAATDSMRLVDYAFEFGRPFTAGTHTILVSNAAQQPHELVLLRLAPGKTVQDFATWATTGGMKGPPPGQPIGGVTLMDPGTSGVFTANLTPGDYGMICFVPDAKDGKMHLLHGMTKQFTVGQT